MENKYFVAIVFVIAALLFVSGYFLSEQAVDIAGCPASWRTTPVVVSSSDLCSSTCTAQPADQQHNAIVDALLCACGKASAGGYAEESINKRIEEVVATAFGYTGTAAEFCEQTGAFLVKRSYG